MSLVDLPRVPEPEVMEDSAEVESYASATAQAFLDALDNTFVEHAIRLVQGRERGRALDIGSGPGQIVLKLARRLTRWKFVGVDRSETMIAQAQESLAAAGGEVAGRVEFQPADGNRLPFPDASFDLVLCNSVLHHFEEPRNLLAEMARVTKPGAAILLRDLRRPRRLAYPFHVRWHGRRYSGEMRRLFRDSVRASYTLAELRQMAEYSALRGVRVFKRGASHIGFERPIAS